MPAAVRRPRRAWTAQVGAGRTNGCALRDDGTVEVRVDHAAWRKEVRRSRPLILSKLQSLLGESVVTALKIVGGVR